MRSWVAFSRLGFPLRPCDFKAWIPEMLPSDFACQGLPGPQERLLFREEWKILRQDFHTHGIELETWHGGERQKEISVCQMLPLQARQGQSFRAWPPNWNWCLSPIMFAVVIFTKHKESAEAMNTENLRTTLWGKKTLKGTGFYFIHFSVPAAVSVGLIHWLFSCWSYMSP